MVESDSNGVAEINFSNLKSLSLQGSASIIGRTLSISEYKDPFENDASAKEED